MKVLVKTFYLIFDFILPKRCLKCGKILNVNQEVCDKCYDELNFILSPYCEKCGHPLTEIAEGKKLFCPTCSKRKRMQFRLSRSALVYDDASKNLILALKFMDKVENAKFLAAMLKYCGKDIFDAGVDLIIPVPLHYNRLVKRRYNQAALLAKELSKYTKITVDLVSLTRHKNTKPQVELMGYERIINVKNAFVVKNPNKIKGKRIVLVDDVLTTGATLKESAIALKKAGAKSVDTLTVARVC